MTNTVSNAPVPGTFTAYLPGSIPVYRLPARRSGAEREGAGAYTARWCRGGGIAGRSVAHPASPRGAQRFPGTPPESRILRREPVEAGGPGGWCAPPGKQSRVLRGGPAGAGGRGGWCAPPDNRAGFYGGSPWRRGARGAGVHPRTTEPDSTAGARGGG